MRRQSTGLLLLVALMVSTTSCSWSQWLTPNYRHELAALRSGQYQVDSRHSTLLFKVNHMQLSTSVGRFNDFSASLDFNPQDMARSQLQALVSMASVDTGNRDLDDTLREPSWLATTQYPQAEFISRSVTPLADGRFTFAGDLTWRGVTRPINLVGEFHGGATNMLTGRYTLGFSATASLARSDFGIDQYQGMVGERVQLEVFAEFQRQP